MTRFTNAMDSNDPLQTAYQFLSGRQPSIVTHIDESDLTGWRHHLAMILSNSTQNQSLTKMVYQDGTQKCSKIDPRAVGI